MKPIKDYFKLEIPTYDPLEDHLLSSFDINSVSQWIVDKKVQKNLVNMDITLFDTLFEDNNFFDQKYFNSPHFDQYQEYIVDTLIPGFLNQREEENKPANRNTQKILEYLLSAGFGSFNYPGDSPMMLYRLLFSGLKPRREPGEGDCYFCSVGANMGLDSQEIRDSISEYLEPNPELTKEIANRYIRGCNGGRIKELSEINNEEYVSQFPALIRKSCSGGGIDCDSCIWGNTDFNPILVDMFQNSLVTFSVETEGTLSQENLYDYFDEDIADLMHKYLLLPNDFDFEFYENQKYVLNISYEINGDKDTFINGTQIPMAIVHRGVHFNSMEFLQ